MRTLMTTAATVLMLTSGVALAQTTPSTGSSATPPAASTSMKTTAPSVLGSTELSADSLIGATVTNSADENVGDVDDVVLGADGQVKYVVVSVGGFLGMGDRLVAMNWNELKLDRAENEFRVNHTKDQLKNAPEYKREKAGAAMKPKQ
ncbi:MAG: PRC-barrel domain-containing protein [Alphaproteobacteria bacterium]|nr:PRC-barrel domain-containing protein [Alphaproteobacteria bacterium]MBU0796075.1 PRC-barrel domain-containing protein [Alphaproteobacteria bacterium]MBU0885774.1 PRC-barrel domain-containing protein [Alphaproteobacteria bacterium]MBU1814477.1 PRC-barrel domain-containing protein [Alphaproteobacteria bacterium]MBU2091019.1 PRC-barrel domain-containing protein [Alphaproteobacteria bacterium]